MGGAKKRSMAQMEKTQDQPDKGKEEAGGQPKKGGKTKSVAEKRSRGLQAPDMNDPKFLGEVGKMSAITPYSLASQFNVKLSVAKDNPRFRRHDQSRRTATQWVLPDWRDQRPTIDWAGSRNSFSW